MTQDINHRRPLKPGEIRTHTVGATTFQVMHVANGSYTQATSRTGNGSSDVIATEPFESDAVHAYAEAIERAENTDDTTDDARTLLAQIRDGLYCYVPGGGEQYLDRYLMVVREAIRNGVSRAEVLRILGDA